MAAQTEIKSGKNEIIKEVSQEIELPKEVSQAGVEIHGAVEFPLDLKKLGVTPTGGQTPLSAVTTTISLPISDDKILAGTKAPLTSALKWLAVWCLKRLKVAHLILKSIHGKIIRVTVK